MSKRDFIFNIKILGFTARTFLKSQDGTMLNQGVRVRNQLIKAQIDHPRMMKDKEVREVYFEHEAAIRSFTKFAVAEEQRRAEEANDREIARMEAEREKHRLGVIARARVAFGLQQRLLAAGYPPALVKQVLFAMLVSAFVGKRV